MVALIAIKFIVFQLLAPMLLAPLTLQNEELNITLITKFKILLIHFLN